jgi:hypothetical protein
MLFSLLLAQYYFRYEGSMVEPPCFNTEVHWRVLKNAIRVSPKQIKKLERLIARRLNPETCKKESAGKPREGHRKRKDVARPLQATSTKHKLVFCECETWTSHTPADIEYCQLPPEERGVQNFTLA